MALNLNQINQQVSQMEQTMTMRAGSRRTRVARAFERLCEFSEAFDMLRDKVERTRGRAAGQDLDWRGAFPPEAPACEPLAQGYDLPECPCAATLIANDGSQIVPDRHALLPYYLLSVGSLVLRHGSGTPPEWEIAQELHYTEEDLYTSYGEIVPSATVHAQRDLLAIRELARLAELHARPPAVALVDGPLLLWSYQEMLPGAQREMEKNIRVYLEALTRIRGAGVYTAGYIDRPGYRGVVNLLALGALAEITAESLRRPDLTGVRDHDLFEIVLRPGQRSALFITQSHVNKTYKAEGDHEVWFFYLNVAACTAEGARAEPHTIARVEVPAWVAMDRASLDCVHALLYQQCQVLGTRYPYVLARADELARIDPLDKQEVERLIQRALIARGERAVPSAKEQTKQLTRAKARRRR
jgi:hypothetical protein